MKTRQLPHQEMQVPLHPEREPMDPAITLLGETHPFPPIAGATHTTAGCRPAWGDRQHSWDAPAGHPGETPSSNGHRPYRTSAYSTSSRKRTTPPAPNLKSTPCVHKGTECRAFGAEHSNNTPATAGVKEGAYTAPLQYSKQQQHLGPAQTHTHVTRARALTRPRMLKQQRLDKQKRHTYN